MHVMLLCDLCHPPGQWLAAVAKGFPTSGWVTEASLVLDDAVSARSAGHP